MASSSLNPVTGAPVFLDTDAPDPAVNPTEVAAYAAKVGTRLIGTTAERNAYAYLRDGIEWYDTTLKRPVVHDGTGWRMLTAVRGFAVVTTDAAGLAYIPHGLGIAPTSVQFTLDYVDDTISGVSAVFAGALTNANIQVVAMRTDSRTRLANTLLRIHWQAIA